MKTTNTWKRGADGQGAKTKQKDREKQDAIENPASSFETPATIVESTSLSSEEKGAALKNWAEDAERLSVAADEGMTGGERSMLPDVKAAEAVLEKQIETGEAPTSPEKPKQPDGKPKPR